MKKLILLFIIAISFGGCKKAIEKAQENLVIQAMTDGQWAITNFVHNGNNITTDFSVYKFKYYSNKKVDAIKNGVLEKTGDWDGDPYTMTTSASFPSPPYPLILINGSWHIDDNGWTFVVASQTVGTETKTMRLDKQ